LESATKWPFNITKDGRSVGNQDNLPIEKHEELQPSRLHKRNQSMKQLEEAVKEIRRLMLSSVEEVVNKEKLDREGPTYEIGKMQQQKQSIGAKGQLWKKFWDPRGFQRS
jgi:hypothetical protein